MSNYRLIEEVKERVLERIENGVALEPKDVVAKIEYASGKEKYENGLSDYHGGINEMYPLEAVEDR